MYGIFTHMWLICMVNVGKYTIHGLFGDGLKEGSIQKRIGFQKYTEHSGHRGGVIFDQSTNELAVTRVPLIRKKTTYTHNMFIYYSNYQNIYPPLVVFQCVSPHLSQLFSWGFFTNQWVTTDAAVQPRSSRSLARYACECASHAFAWGIDQGTPGKPGGGKKNTGVVCGFPTLMRYKDG